MLGLEIEIADTEDMEELIDVLSEPLLTASLLEIEEVCDNVEGESFQEEEKMALVRPDFRNWGEAVEDLLS